MVTLDIEKAEKIVKRFPEKKILVIGDIILDEYIWGSVKRISPEAPVPVVEAKRRSYMPGGAANVARNLRDLGLSVSVVGGIGNDSIGLKILDVLQKSNIGVDGIIKMRNRPTTQKTRVIGQHQQMVRIDWENCKDIESEYVDKIEKYVIENADSLDAVIFEDYGKGLITQELLARILKITGKKNIFTSFDPKLGHVLNLQGIGIVTPNHHEAFDANGTRVFEDEEDKYLDEVGFSLIDKWGVQSVLITLGECGMALFEKNKDSYKIPTVAREVFDVSGAGDTVIASLTAAIVAGASFIEAAEFSNYAAGVVVGKSGTASVTPGEIIDSMIILMK